MMALYGLPEGAFESVRSGKGRVVDQGGGGLYTCHVTLEPVSVSYYLQLAFVPLKHFWVHLVIMQLVFLCHLTPGSITIVEIRKPPSGFSETNNGCQKEMYVCTYKNPS